jgi:GNAT superfamily N-acetyltransferase
MELELVSVAEGDADKVSAFLRLGRDYLKDMAFEERERFLQSILARQGEPDHWLLLLKHKNEYVGFAHVKIDKNERPGWGFILEFYIVPAKRRMGLGRGFFNLIAGMLKSQGVKDIRLLATKAIPFWRSLGFLLTEEVDKETGQNILTKSLRLTQHI